jgi:hypothetical protein
MPVSTRRIRAYFRRVVVLTSKVSILDALNLVNSASGSYTWIEKSVGN